MEVLSSSVCRACRLRLQVQKPVARVFSTTPSRSHIPPESPAYIDVPQPYQSIPERRPQVKGILPVPRELFPRSRPDKPGPKYLANVTPEPLAKNIPPPEKQTVEQKYKLRMAELRKSHLREGLTQLYARKKSSDARILRRTVAKSDERARLVAQAEREDERLTNVSIPTAMRPQQPLQLSPKEEAEIFAARKQRHAAILKAKEDDRKDRLHTLYMNARKFITDQEQLHKAIDEAFSTGSMPIWDRGLPYTMEQMLRAGTRPVAQEDALDAINPTADRLTMFERRRNEKFEVDQARMRRIAEKLSGGKM